MDATRRMAQRANTEYDRQRMAGNTKQDLFYTILNQILEEEGLAGSSDFASARSHITKAAEELRQKRRARNPEGDRRTPGRRRDGRNTANVPDNQSRAANDDTYK